MEIEITRLHRYKVEGSQTRAFVNVALKSEDFAIFLENLTIREITKNGKNKLIVSFPSYKSAPDTYREIVNIKGQLYWDLTNMILEEYMTTRDVEPDRIEIKEIVE